MIFGRVRSLLTMVGIFSILVLPAPLFAAEYVIGAGDILFISVLAEKELDTVATVTPGGKISFPLVGDVQAAGLTAEELADQLKCREARRGCQQERD